MDEFTGIAVWILIIYLSINAAIVWFDSSSVIQNAGLGVGVTLDSSYSASDLNSFNTNLFGVDCSTVSAGDLVNTTACGISQIYNSGAKFVNSLWHFVTAWSSLLNAILSPLGSLGQLFLSILIPVFALIEFIAIFVVTLRIVGVIRGGS